MSLRQRLIILLPLAVSLTACSSGSTGPKGGSTGNTTTTTYAGLFASPAASGSFTAKIVAPVSGAVHGGPRDGTGVGGSGSVARLLGAGGATMTLTVVLLDQTVLTLSGTVAGTSFSVSDSEGDSCTGNVANLLNATCFFALEGGADVNLLAVITAADVFGGLTTYCGFETMPNSSVVDATILLGIWGLSTPTVEAIDTSFIARVATSNNSLSFYLGRTATYSALADSAVTTGYTNWFDGTFTGPIATGTWSGTDVNALGTIGNWTTTYPCQLYTAGLSGGGAVAFTAAVNAPAPASQTVTISPSTVGPLTAVVPASATWLTATTSGEVVTLTAAPQASAATLTAAVTVWPQFAQNAPLTINVSYNVTSAAPPLAVSTSTVPSGTVGTLYNNVAGGVQLAATGGLAPYRWTVSSGTLPTGLTLSTGGQLSGTPTVANTFNFTVSVSDATTPTAQTAARSYSVVIASASTVVIATTSPLSPGAVGSLYATSGVQFAATGGTAPYTWAVTSTSPAAPPPGVSLSASGLLSGTPTAAGAYTFTVRATDHAGNTASGQFSVTVAAALAITTASTLPGGLVGVLYNGGAVPVGEQFAATGGTGAYSWAITSPPTTVPPGLTFTSAGLLAGRPTVASTYTFTVQVTDAGSNTKSGSFTIIIAPGPLLITTNSSLPGGAQNTPYGPLQFAAQGGTGTYTWSITSATTTIPPGLSLNSVGSFSGTPTAAGAYSFTVQVADAASHMSSGSFGINIAPPANTAGLWLGNANDQLLEYTAANNGLSTINGPTTIATSSPNATGVNSLATDYAGNLWMSSASKGVSELPASNFTTGTTSKTIALQTLSFAGATSPHPAGIVFGPAGGLYPDSGLWVADSANPAIYRYTPTDLAESSPATNTVFWVNSIEVSFGSGSAPIGRTRFAGLAFDARGNLWVLDQAKSRLLEAAGGSIQGAGILQVVEMFVGADSTSQPQSLAFDASGNLWISFLGSNTNGAIYEYSKAQLGAAFSNPTAAPYARLSVTGAADSIMSIAFDQIGNLWLVEAAHANASTALAMIANTHLGATGAYAVSPDLTWAQGASMQQPTSIAWNPAPSNLPLGSVVRRAPPPNASRLKATASRTR